jgi:hypothetical protein
MTGRSPREPDSAFAGRREVSWRNTEVGGGFAWGEIMLDDDRLGRLILDDERGCAAHE